MKKGILFVVLVIVLFTSGCADKEATAEVDGKAMKLHEIKEELEKAKDDLYEKNNEIEEAEKEIEDIKELKKIAKERDKVEKDLQKSKSELETVKADTKRAEEGLERLRGEVDEAESEPKKLNAGYHYFGDDVEAGNYILKPQQGHTGNVFVRGLDGYSKVSETFGPGNDGHSISEFKFEGLEGEEIEATIPILLYPIE